MIDKTNVMIGSGENSAIITASKGSVVMIGNGEHASFIEVGITPEESRNKINQEIDKMLEKYKKEKVLTKKNKLL